MAACTGQLLVHVLLPVAPVLDSRHGFSCTCPCAFSLVTCDLVPLDWLGSELGSMWQAPCSWC